MDNLFYRVGTHGSFNGTMLAELGKPFALRGLTTRQPEDPSIALVDAWAVVLDILTFYQERIVNEGFLRTAQERRSLLELARAIGYELRPGLAASTYLAFSIDSFPGGPVEAVVPAGTKVQSVPAQDETPQVFETSANLSAKAEWNALRPRAGRPAPLGGKETSVFLAGANLGLKSGDAILFIDSDLEEHFKGASTQWALRRLVESEELSNALGVKVTTRVSWREPIGFQPVREIKLYLLRQRVAVFGYNAPDWRIFSKEAKANFLGHPPAEDQLLEWPDYLIYTPIPPKTKKAKPSGSVFAGSATASDIGFEVEVSLSFLPKKEFLKDTLDLDQVYAQLHPGTWAVAVTPEKTDLFRITQCVDASRADFGLTSKTTRITLEGDPLAEFETAVRSLHLFVQSQPLIMADRPLTSLVTGDLLWVDSLISELPAGRWLAISGRDSLNGQNATELVRLRSQSTRQGTTTLELAGALKQVYQRETVVISANVVAASHGETRAETLGDGNGSLAFQTFPLQFKPLTHVSAAGPQGSASTLVVRVDGVQWSEARSFLELGPGDHGYVRRTDENGTTWITCGDGTHGARLSSGSGNVEASYRSGLGLGGLLKAGQLSLLLSRPLGVGGVINPVPAVGAANPETVEEVRRNAALTILTLERVVSLQDYEDFARAFAGIGKAMASQVWDGGQQWVHLTVAGSNGGPLPETAEPFQNLLQAMDQARHATRQVRVDSYRLQLFELHVAVRIQPSRQVSLVLQSVRSTLLDTYSAQRQELGQGIDGSGILSVVQRVPGVEAATILKLHFANGPGPVRPLLGAPPAHWDGAVMVPATLVTLEESGLTVSEMTL